MRSSASFFRIFPPPSFMLMPHAGLDISDDAIRCIAYSGFGAGRKLADHGAALLPLGLVDGGDVKDEKEFLSRLTAFAREHSLSMVKISVPEEKAYLFQTEVPDAGLDAIRQNIEFKLEENVPLAAPDATFYFDLLPPKMTGGPLRACVSVVPRTYIEHHMAIFEKAGLTAVAFEVVPKSVARAVVPLSASRAKIVVHSMERKTGIYVVANDVVSFASTVSLGTGSSDEAQRNEAAIALTGELGRVASYWASHGTGLALDEIIIVGKHAASLVPACEKVQTEGPLTARVGDIWRNAFDVDRYLPAIPQEESLEYAAAAGLAFDPFSGV